MGLLAIDIEANSLDQWADDYVVFLCQWDDGRGDRGCWREGEPLDAIHAALGRHEALVGANFSYDIHGLREGLGIDLLAGGHKLHDVQTLARVCCPGRFTYTLESLGTDMLGADSTEGQRELAAAAKRHKLAWTQEDKDYYGLWKLEPELMIRYGMEDVDLTIRVWNHIWRSALKSDVEVYKMEIAGVAPLLRGAEAFGTLVDQAALADLKRSLEEERDEFRLKLLAQGISEEALGADATEDDAKVTASSKALLRDLLAAGVPLYRTTPKSGELDPKTGKKRPDHLAVNKDALKEFKKRYPVVADLLSWRSRCTILRTFIRAMEKADPRIHTSFRQAEARTGRMSCIAEGSLVDAPRNLLLHPRGIPIEDIQVGQYVYSHGADGVPRPQRVLAKQMTGHRRVLRLVWRASGSKSYLGELVATPEHPIRLEDGSYRRLDELRPNDKLAYLGRSINADGRATINWSGDRKVYEHRHLVDAPVVHHINALKYDNRVENLQACTDEAEHGRLHGGTLAGVERRGRMTCPFTPDEFRAAVAGGIRKAMSAHGHDYACWQRWALDVGIAIPDMRRAKQRNNHRVVMVVSDGETCPVWDLQIENTPCFVVNEIGVHNSAKPNMQNLPRPDKDNPDMTEAEMRLALGVRSVIVPAPGNALLVCDYDSIEVRALAYYIADPDLTRQLDEGLDMHSLTASRVHGGRYEDYAKGGPNDAKRTLAKNTTFTAMYGGGARLLGQRLGVSTEDASVIKYSTLAAIPGYYDLDDRVKASVQRRSWPHVTTILGRRLHVPKDKPYVALNTLIQGTSAELMKLGMIAAAPALAKFGYRVILVVHDELVAEGPAACAPQALAAMISSMESAFPLTPRLKAAGSWSQTSYALAK